MNVADGWDIVVTAKPLSSEASYVELEDAIHKSIDRLGVQLISSNSPEDPQVVV
jgi:hypothetical protein